MAVGTLKGAHLSPRSDSWSYSQQLDLLPADGFTAWLPDETLFSLTSRRHYASGNVRAAETCVQLFGHRQRGAAHDFPARIDEFVSRTQGQLGSAPSIIRTHTLLSFYLPFRTLDDSRDAIAAMRGDGIGSLKFRLGILTSRFRAHHPLKACRRCMADDRERFGVAYWHLAHQYPSVWICPTHELLLLESTVKANGVGRFLWHLPNEIALVRPVSAIDDDSIDGRLKARLQHLANAALGLAHLPAGFFFDTERLVNLHLGALQERGLRFVQGRIRLNEAAAQYQEFVAPLRVIPELSAFPKNVTEAVSQLGRLLRLPRTGVHPLRHLMLILWLYETWEMFLAKYTDGRLPDGRTLMLFQELRSPAAAADPRAEQHARFLTLVSDDNLSVTKAAQQVGVDTCTGIAWATKAGIHTPRRSKTLTPQRLSRIIQDLRQGRDKGWIAMRRQVPRHCVTRVLRSEVGLHQAWIDALQERRRAEAREAWQRASGIARALGPKAVRGLAPAAYAWLYRNDRAWLRTQINLLVPARRSNHASVNWDVRDHELAQAVSEALLKLQERMPGVTLSLNDLHRYLPELRAKLNCLDRLPLTRRALERGIRRNRRHMRNGDLL